MKKHLFILFLLIPSISFAAPPTRVSTYTTGEVISSTDVTANEDALFNYVQAGVDTYKDLSIVDADISASANIQSDKLNLTSIEQAVAITSTGSFTNGGTTDLNGAVTIGDAIGDTLVIDAGSWTLTNATTWTLTGALTFSGTIANLGIVTTADINGGTMDGVQIAGATTTGTIFYNDASDDVASLVPGADNTVLTSTGATGIPAYESPGIELLSTTTVTDGSNTGDITITAGKRYLVFVTITSAADTTFYIRFDSDVGAADYSWILKTYDWAGVPTTETITNDVSDDDIPLGTVNLNGYLTGNFTFDATADTNGDIFLKADFDANEATAGAAEARTIFGKYLDAGTLTDYEIFTSGATLFTGTVKTYQMN